MSARVFFGVALAAAATATFGCYSSEPEREVGVAPTGVTSPPPGPDLKLATVPVSASAVGRVGAIADLDTQVIVFGDRAVASVAGGAVAVRANVGREWRGAARVPAADRSGPWGVGVTGDGKLVRLRDTGALDDVTMRYGIVGNDVARSIASLDDKRFAVGLEGAVLVVDVATATTTRFETGPFTALVAQRDRIATMDQEGATVLELESGKRRRISLPGVGAIAFEESGALLAADAHAIHRDGPQGLSMVHMRADVEIRSLTSSAQRVWFVAGRELFALEGNTVRRAPDVDVAPDQTVVGANDGGVWITGTTLARQRPDLSPEEAAWVANVLPIYQRACSRCHAPGGSAGVDLSSFGAWRERRAALQQRVLDTASMPPPPVTLEPAERDAIRTWLRP